MANEVTIAADLAYSDATGVRDELRVGAIQQDSAGRRVARAVQLVATAETAIDLGGLAAVGWVMLVNRDPTNFVTVKTAASGVVFAKLPAAGGFCLLYLGAGVTAPVAVADTAACLVDVFLVSP